MYEVRSESLPEPRKGAARDMRAVTSDMISLHQINLMKIECVVVLSPVRVQLVSTDVADPVRLRRPCVIRMVLLKPLSVL